MRIGGLQKLSLIDYPSEIAAVIFTQGCNFRCPYCYNLNLVYRNLDSVISEKDIFQFLWQRHDLLSGVVVTGGEPTIHHDLPDFITKIKRMGFKVKLDTNGSNPAMLKKLIESGQIDFVAMDIKSSLRNYCKATGAGVDKERILESIDIIKSSGLDHQFRTTAVKPLCSTKDFESILKMIDDPAHYTIQELDRRHPVIDPDVLIQPQYTPLEVAQLQEKYCAAPVAA